MPDDAPASSSPDAFEQRTRFGSYEILRTEEGSQHLLGKGAFGRTYKARHVFLERLVALKIINDRFLTNAKARERFLAEARAAAKLSHANIAQILDFGETDGILFYAMEYCSGGDLSDYVKRNGPLSVVQAVQIGLQVAGALQCAHAAGFIHRDLKPSNLMMASPDGPIMTKLIDFGLVIVAPTEESEPMDPDAIPTIEQRFIGTPLFASPEQLLVQTLDARSDFFALGMTLWFLLLGAAPDAGNSAAIVRARLSADSYAPRLPRKLPQTFANVLARLLEKRPENRFANAAQLLAAFQKCAVSLGLPGATAASFLASVDDGPDAAPPEPAALEHIEVPLEECYSVQGQRGASATGADYEATMISEQRTVWLHFLKPEVMTNARLMDSLQKNVGFLQRREFAGMLRPLALRAHPDRTVIVIEAPEAPDLLTFSKDAGAVRLTEARPLLQAIAAACDAVTAAGLPLPELDPHRVFVRQPAAAPNPAAALTTAEPRLLPQFLTKTAVNALEGTPETVSDAPGGQFAVLIYRLLSARNLPAKPALTPQDCLAIPGLSEDANRILAQAIARQLVHATCSELLADLLIAEGLMGAGVTRTQATIGATSSAAATHGSGGEVQTVAPHEAPPSEDAQLTAAPPPPLRPAPARPAGPPPIPPPVETTHAPVPISRESSAWPILVAALLLLALLGGAAFWFAHRGSGEKTSFFSRSATVHLQGDVPAHATAHFGDKDLPLEREGDGWRVTLDGRTLKWPATLAIEAKGFAPTTVELKSAADLDQPHDASLKRAEGTLAFNNRGGADYDHAVLKMTAQLPDELAYVELERFNRGIELTEPEVKLPTGIYQVTLRGANERAVRPRIFPSVTIKPGETVTFDVPPTMAGRFVGTVTTTNASTPSPVEITIEPDLSTGVLIEQGKRGTRRVPIAEGQIDVEGAYSARILYSLAIDSDEGFDQLMTLKRDGTRLVFSASESPDENPAVERRLNRQPLTKTAYSVEGTLSPEAP